MIPRTFLPSLGRLCFLSVTCWWVISGCSGDAEEVADDDDSASNGGDDDTTPQGDDDSTSGEVTITSTEPANNATDAWYRQDLTAEFSAPVTSATVTVVDGGGNDVPGETLLSDSGYSITFNPHGEDETQHLSASTPYEVTVTFDGNTGNWSFTTSDLGTPVSDPPAVVGVTYNLDLASAEITEPPGVGQVLAPYLSDVIVLFSPTALDEGAGSIEVLGALGDDSSGTLMQDMCSPSLPLTEAVPGEFANPYFQVGPALFESEIQGINIIIDDLLIGGDFTSDGSAVEEAVFAGQLDSRNFAGLLGDDIDAICELLTTLGIACEACPSDGELYCLSVRAEQITAASVPGVSLIEVTDEDVAADENCQ